jgi:hypothetical protein
MIILNDNFSLQKKIVLKLNLLLQECEEWRIKGEKAKGDALRGCMAVVLALAIILVYLYTSQICKCNYPLF